MKVQSDEDMSEEQHTQMLEKEMSEARDRYVTAKRVYREAKLAAKIAKKQWKRARKRLRTAQDETEARASVQGKKSVAHEPSHEKTSRSSVLGARVASSPEVSRRPRKARKKGPVEHADVAASKVKPADATSLKNDEIAPLQPLPTER